MNFMIFTSIPVVSQTSQSRSDFLWILFYIFSSNLRRFRQNKSVSKTTETKHTDSKLHFATNNIKFCLLVFENQLNGDAMHVTKKQQT